AAEGNFHVAVRCSGEIQSRAEAPGRVQSDDLADLPGVSVRRTGHDVHRMGQSDLQSQRLERPMLLDDGCAPRDIQRLDRKDAMGEVRTWPRSALPGLHGACRLRTVGCTRSESQTGR